MQRAPVRQIMLAGSGHILAGFIEWWSMLLRCDRSGSWLANNNDLPGCSGQPGERGYSNMYRVSRSVSFCYGHRLLNYAGKCRHLHGHNARAEITLQSPVLDETGMVEDFTRMKQVLLDWLDAEIDHTLLLHRDDPLLPLLTEAGERVYVTDENPTAEVIARMIFDHVSARGFPVVEVRLWETDTSVASYRAGAD